MPYSADDHIFALCAYKESPYLEDCIKTLIQQSAKSRIILCTATPNDHIAGMAEKYDLPLFINNGPRGIAEDWNFAYAQANAPLVTLAHQDDVYEPDFLSRVLERLNRAKRPMISFTDYYELRNGKKVFADGNKIIWVKEFAMIPLRIKAFEGSRWVRRRVLSLCDPICCPSVTFVKGNLPEVVFESHFASDLDWQAWEKLSRLKGDFCYINTPLMGHRIHEESTTTKVIGKDRGRSVEDLEMYLKFWPRPIAKLLNALYSNAQKSNKL